MESYNGVLKEKAESGEGEYKLTVEIPAFKSKYPTILTRVPAADAQKFTVGQTYSWLLERGNLRKGEKEGSTRLYDYWWNYRGIGGIPAAPEQAKPASRQDGFRSDATGRSIERQVALKAAVEYAGYRIREGKDVAPADILKAADAFDRWLANAPRTHQEPQDSPRNSAAVPDAGKETEEPF